MRLFISSFFVICATTMVFWGPSTSQTLAEPVRLVVADEMPLYNQKEKLYGSTLNDYNDAVDTPNSPNTVTVTAIVLPVRIITLYDGHIEMSSNHEENDGYYIVKLTNGKSVPLTPSIWQSAKTCLYSASELIGNKICSSKLEKE